MLPLYMLHQHIAKDFVGTFTKHVAADANTHLVADTVGTET